jgi:hypothetical protein
MVESIDLYISSLCFAKNRVIVKRNDTHIQYIAGLIKYYSRQILRTATFLKICGDMTVLAGYFDILV